MGYAESVSQKNDRLNIRKYPIWALAFYPFDVASAQ